MLDYVCPPFASSSNPYEKVKKSKDNPRKALYGVVWLARYPLILVFIVLLNAAPKQNKIPPKPKPGAHIFSWA